MSRTTNNGKTKKESGWFIPIEIVELFQSGKINSTEAFLLATIDSLVDENRGCHAGNGFLAEKMGTTGNVISSIITKLKRIGLITQIDFDGRERNLETIWSKIKLSLKALKEHKAEIKGRMCKNKKQSQPKAGGRVNQKLEAESTKSTNRVTSRVTRGENKIKTMSELKSSDGNTSSNGDSSSNNNNSIRRKNPRTPKSKEKKKPTKFDTRAAKELRDVITSTVKINCNASMTQWANQIRMMRERDQVPQEKIRETIKWYANHIGGKFDLEAYSANSFRAKFQNGQFTAAMRRDSVNGNGAESNGDKTRKNAEELLQTMGE